MTGQIRRLRRQHLISGLLLRVRVVVVLLHILHKMHCFLSSAAAAQACLSFFVYLSIKLENAVVGSGRKSRWCIFVLSAFVDRCRAPYPISPSFHQFAQLFFPSSPDPSMHSPPPPPSLALGEYPLSSATEGKGGRNV